MRFTDGVLPTFIDSTSSVTPRFNSAVAAAGIAVAKEKRSASTPSTAAAAAATEV